MLSLNPDWDGLKDKCANFANVNMHFLGVSSSLHLSSCPVNVRLPLLWCYWVMSQLVCVLLFTFLFFHIFPETLVPTAGRKYIFSPQTELIQRYVCCVCCREER